MVVAMANARAKAAARALPACLGGHGTEEGSPVWMRDYSATRKLSADATDRLDAVLDRCCAERIVMGHTPQAIINGTAAGKAWRVDVGASRGMGGGEPQVLEIIHGAVEDEMYVITASQGRIPASKLIVG